VTKTDIARTLRGDGRTFRARQINPMPSAKGPPEREVDYLGALLNLHTRHVNYVDTVLDSITDSQNRRTTSVVANILGIFGPKMTQNMPDMPTKYATRLTVIGLA
jgi:hypothetical protein